MSFLFYCEIAVKTNKKNPPGVSLQGQFWPPDHMLYTTDLNSKTKQPVTL